MAQKQLEAYSVKKGEEFIDWNKQLTWLKKIAKKQKVTEEEYNKAKELSNQASQWVTCACGNMCSIIPRDGDGQPKDSILFDRGCDFAGNLDDIINSLDTREQYHDTKYALEAIDDAKETLKNIEYRSAELIKEITKEQKTYKIKK